MDGSRLTPVPIASLLALAAAAACHEPPEVDLVGPRVLGSSLVGPRSVEQAVTPELVVSLSEPLDPASIHAGSVALVEWEPLESCALTPICEQGSCERGTCQRSPLGSSQRRAIDRGEFADGLSITIELGEGEAGPDTRLIVRPRRPLAAHRRHSLVLGAALRDRSGAPLLDAHGQVGAWQRDFVTAGRGSGGPEPRLVAPSPGQTGVPTNLATIDTQLWPPIPPPAADATLLLEPEPEPGRGGDPAAVEPIELVEPLTCPGWAPGTCLRWRPAAPLEPGVRYRPAGGALVDRHGRPALLPAIEGETWFEVGRDPDLDPPQASTVAQMRGRCLAVWVEVGEPVAATLFTDEGEGEGEARARATIAGAGWIGLAIDEPLAVEARVPWTLELRDLADNHATVEGEVAAGSSFSSALPRLALTEILANPSGPEPDAEFVELRAGPEGASLAEVHLADASLAEVHDAWASGELLGDPLPALELEPDELALIVAADYGLEPGDDPQPPAGTRLIRVDASLGSGGLKNAGERVTLWAQTEHGPAAIASYGDWLDVSAKAHEGRSVIAGHDGCDLPGRWRSHPFGRSTPGGAD